MEMEGNLEEIFDLKPIVPEIYNSQQFSNSNTKFQTEISINTNTHDNRPTKTSNYNTNKHLMNSISSTWNNSCRNAPQEMIITNKPLCPPPPPAAAAAANCQLISFENSSSDSDYKLDQMAKDYNISSLTPGIITFSSLGTEEEDNIIDQYNDAANNHEMMNQKRICTATRTPSQAQEHLVAERKRREKLGQLFISLSKVVPGLKKLDKASLLEDAINHLKSLQERVKALEEEEINIKKNSIVTAVKDIEEISINNNNGSTSGESAAPQIKARISNRHVLIKICCKKQIGLMSRIPCEMEKMNLSVIDMRLMPFGEAALDITILAEMHNDFRGTVKDIVDHLQMVFLNPRTWS